MNIFDLLEIKNFSNFRIPNATIIELILNDIATPKFEKIKLKNDKHKYSWVNKHNSDGIKIIIRFSYRGQRGNFAIGTNFNFIPLINKKNEVKYEDDTFHIFENIEYFTSKEPISLWNKYFFEKSLKNFISKNIENIHRYAESSLSIEKSIDNLKRQIASSEFSYKIHYPNQKYVLAFLYAKIGKLKEAKRTMNEYLEVNPKTDKEIIKMLEKI